VAGRYSFADLHVVREVVAELEHGASLPAVLRALDAERQGQLALDFQPACVADRAPAKVVSLRAQEPLAPTPPTAPATRAQDLVAASQAMAAKYFSGGRRAGRGREPGPRGRGGRLSARAALFDPHLVPGRGESRQHLSRAR
jgi:hypothetical protein